MCGLSATSVDGFQEGHDRINQFSHIRTRVHVRLQDTHQDWLHRLHYIMRKILGTVHVGVLLVESELHSVDVRHGLSHNIIARSVCTISNWRQQRRLHGMCVMTHALPAPKLIDATKL
jgi:hypothetical protein